MKPLKPQVTEALAVLAHFMGRRQTATVLDLLQGEEGKFFEDKMIELAGIVTAMPQTYEKRPQGDKAVVHLHYFTGGAANWWIIERDVGTIEDRDGQPAGLGPQLQAYGLANFFGGPNDHDAELGYISIAEILANHGELDFHFQPRTLAELKAGKLKKAA